MNSTARKATRGLAPPSHAYHVIGSSSWAGFGGAVAGLGRSKIHNRPRSSPLPTCLEVPLLSRQVKSPRTRLDVLYHPKEYRPHIPARSPFWKIHVSRCNYITCTRLNSASGVHSIPHDDAGRVSRSSGDGNCRAATMMACCCGVKGKTRFEVVWV